MSVTAAAGTFGIILSIVKPLLPIFLNWIVKAYKNGIISEAERDLIGRQLVMAAEELNVWNDIRDEIRQRPDASLRDILTGRVPAEGEAKPTEP